MYATRNSSKNDEKFIDYNKKILNKELYIINGGQDVYDYIMIIE